MKGVWAQQARAASICFALGLALALGVAAGTAERAEARTAGHAGPGGNFGLGLVLGTPTGLSAEYFADRANSIHVALGLDVFEDQDFYLHLNWRGYLAAINDRGAVRLPLYVGLGGYVSDRDLDALGLRAPFGFGIDFRRAPVKLFFELAAQLELTGSDRLRGRIGGALGFHIYF
jgi:hypothetical protein